MSCLWLLILLDPGPSRRVPEISILWSENPTWDNLILFTKWNLSLHCTAFWHCRPITEASSSSRRGHSLTAHGVVYSQLRTTEAQSLILSSYELTTGLNGLPSIAAFPGAYFASSLSSPALNSSEWNNCPWPSWKVSHRLKVPMSSYYSAGFWYIVVFLFLH